MQHGPRKRDIALQAFSFLLALGVGILIGARSCAPDPVTEIETVVKEVPVEKIVYECPPEPEPEPTPTKPETVKKRPSDGKKELPDANEVEDPLRRKRLLAWVRDESKSLASCNASSAQTHRLAVTLHINKTGKIKKVTFDAPPKELPGTVQTCLRRQMTNWKAPEDLVVADERLVFGLTI